MYTSLAIYCHDHSFSLVQMHFNIDHLKQSLTLVTISHNNFAEWKSSHRGSKNWCRFLPVNDDPRRDTDSETL